MRRPWINFETGAAWQSERPLVPVVAGGLDKSEVIEPLRSLQLLSLEVEPEAKQAFAELGSVLGDPLQFCSAVISIAARARIAAIAQDDWEGIEHEGQYYAWDGSIETLSEGQPRPVPVGLVEALNQLGRRQQYGIDGDLLREHSGGFALVYLIDLKRRRRHKLVGEHGQVLLSRDEQRKPGA